jgi:hypothetical protein
MGQTSVPETLVIHQKLTPGYNPKTFKQHYEHGGSLQLHMKYCICKNIVRSTGHGRGDLLKTRCQRTQAWYGVTQLMNI